MKKISYKSRWENCLNCKKKFKSEGALHCSKSCWSRRRIGKKNAAWKGGKSLKNGYIIILTSRNPRTYRYEHRVKMEKFLNRKLREKETIHHKNGIRTDNRICNLKVLSRSDHLSLHGKQRKLKWFGKNQHLNNL